METKKLLCGKVNKNIVMGLSWLCWIFALVAFIIDFKTLDVEEKREYVSMFICAAVGMILGITVIIPFAMFVLVVVEAIMAFMGKSFKVPGAYHLAAAIIK